MREGELEGERSEGERERGGEVMWGEGDTERVLALRERGGEGREGERGEDTTKIDLCYIYAFVEGTQTHW